MDKTHCGYVYIPFFLSWARPIRQSDRYPIEILLLSGIISSSMVNLDEENEEEDGDGTKESMLKLFLMVTQLDDDEVDRSSCTPKRRRVPTRDDPDLKDVQVLELWPMFPQCEHFLPIISFHFKFKIFSADKHPPSKTKQCI